MFKNSIGNYRLKIAFDFDDTLTDILFFSLAQRLIIKGHDVWIITSRKDKNNNADILKVAAELNISDKIIYTEGQSKKEAYFSNKFDLLFDDADEWHCNPINEAGGIALSI